MSSLSSIKCWGEPLAPHAFLQKHGLPQVVRVHEGHRVQGPSRLDLDRPLLLYKAYSCRKVHARSIDRDSKTGGITYVGPPLLLPDSYPGWLAVITDDGHTAGYFTSIAQVASAQVPSFLTRDQTSGYREESTDQGSSRYTKVKISAGEVLQFLGAYEDTTYSSRHHKTTRYAKVVDRQGDLLFLPFNSTGKFFSVAGRKTRSVSHVYQISQLLHVASLPLTVRIVAGSRPRTRCTFTGLLRLEWVEDRHVILSCALKGRNATDPMLLEIDVDSAFTFLRPMDDQKVRLSKPFNKMLRFCKEQGDSWLRQIKVAHHVVPVELKKNVLQDPGPASSGDTAYEEEDSAVRSSTMKSLSSSKSSASSRLFKRLRLLHQSWKSRQNNSHPSKHPPFNHHSTSDFHLYETVRGNRRNSWGRSSISTEILDDDGYVTSDFGEESTYDSVG